MGVDESHFIWKKNCKYFIDKIIWLNDQRKSYRRALKLTLFDCIALFHKIKRKKIWKILSLKVEDWSINVNIKIKPNYIPSTCTCYFLITQKAFVLNRQSDPWKNWKYKSNYSKTLRSLWCFNLISVLDASHRHRKHTYTLTSRCIHFKLIIHSEVCWYFFWFVISCLQYPQHYMYRLH